MEPCNICQADSTQELTCSNCKYSLHYSCALGFDPPDEFKLSILKGQYICPPCIVGTSYGLLHLALDAHSKQRPPSPIEGDFGQLHNVSSESVHDGSHGSNSTVLDAGQDHEATVPIHRSNRPNTVIRNNSTRTGRSVESLHGEGEFIPIHPSDMARSKRLSMILNTFKNLPDHVNTIVYTDSNGKGVRGKEVDPKGNSVCVRSFSGLCIVSAVYALQQYDKFPYRGIKKIVWCLGTNDAWHGSTEHCPNETQKYATALYSETRRIFPNASVTFVLPSTGIKGVSGGFIKELEQLMKQNCPEMKTIHPPSMRGMMKPGGKHINDEGTRAFVNFLMRRFTKCKPRDVIREPPIPVAQGNRVNPGVGDVNRSYQQNPWVQHLSVPTVQNPRVDTRPSAPGATQTVETIQNGAPSYTGLAREIAVAFKQMMQQCRAEPQNHARHQDMWPPY